MTKADTRECAKVNLYIQMNETALAARTMSMMIRAARSDKARRELLAVCATMPRVTSHADFII